MDISFCLNQPQAVSPADRVQIDDAVDQFHAASGKSERARQGDSRKNLTETSGRIAGAKRLYRRIIITFFVQCHQWSPVGRLFSGNGSGVIAG